MQSWGDTSNHDQLESGTELGGALALAVGDEAGLSDVGLPKSDFALDLEVELSARRESLHGRNQGDDHRTADGRELHVLALSFNLWPGWQATRWLTLYAGGGVGPCMAAALGNTAWEACGQAGGGARVNLTPELSIELAERSVWMRDVQLRGYRATYDAVHGVLVGVRWEFKD